MKEIHFYTDLCDIEQVSDWDLETMNTDYTSTKSSIGLDMFFPLINGIAQ